jgi:N-acetylglucosamine-6-sulfatase
VNRRTFLSTASAAFAQTGAPRVRNIVFILVDDHRYDALSCAGHPWLKTPHLDRLAAGGAFFRNSFVTTSLCSPSRASILTGLYMHAHKVEDLDSKLPTFPALLQKQGYRTGFYGKWHMGGDSDAPRPGFDDWFSFPGQGQYEDPPVNDNGVRKVEKGNITDILTDRACRFIERNASSTKPFCLYLSHKGVHFPFQPSPRHKALHATDPVPRPSTIWYNEERNAQKPEWVKRRRYTRHGVEGLFGQTISFEDAYRDYMRCLLAIDDSVGRVTASLESKGLLNDTLIVFMGDNGYMWGEHGLVDKRAMYEESMRVPMIVHCPSLFATGQRPAEMALNLDIAPTLLDAAGVRDIPKMHGRSLLPVLQGKASDWRKDFVYEYEWERDYPYTPTITGLRTEQHSFMLSQGLWDLDELYDIRKDPKQLQNLLSAVKIGYKRGRMIEQITDPQLKQTVAGLQKRLAQLLRETGGDPRRAGEAIEGYSNAL